MKTIAIIAECNPLHNGHAHLFREARRLSGADCLVVLLSGDYVQRGAPAILDKYSRTELVLACGADLVLELPVAVATGSAQRFADGAVCLLDRLGVIEELWFGSETGTIAPFLRAADLLATESPSFQTNLKDNLTQGLSMPAARANALEQEKDADEEVCALLQHPNDTLGLEYVLSLRRRNSTITPHTLPRRATDASDPQTRFVSASDLRAALRNAQNGTSSSEKEFRLQDVVPKETLALYERILSEQPLLRTNDFSAQLSYALQQAMTAAHPEDRYLDLPVALANRIRNLLPQYSGAEEFASLLKTRERAHAQIRRALLHILLQISEETYRTALAQPHLRMLGHAQPESLFRRIKETGQLSLCAGGAALQESFYACDLFASLLYESIRSEKNASAFLPEESRPLLLAEPQG